MNSWSLAIASLIQSNYNINFIPSNIKALTYIYYITNYAIKSNYSKYQKVMAVAILRKTFGNYNNNLITDPSNYTPTLDKFALKAFN